MIATRTRRRFWLIPKRAITATVLGMSGFAVPPTLMAAEPNAGSHQIPNARQKTYALAKAAYDAERYEECKQILLNTGNITHVTLVLLAQAECELKEYQECAAHAEEALRSPEHKPDKRKLIMEILAEAAQEVGTLTLTVKVPGASVSVDEKAIGTTPIEHPTYLHVGTHKVTVVKTGHRSVTREVEAKRGVTISLVLDLPEQPAQVPATAQKALDSSMDSSEFGVLPTPDPFRERSRDMKNGPSVVPLIAGGALTIGAVLAGLHFNARAHSQYSQATELQSRLEPQSCTSPQAPLQADCSNLRMHLERGDRARNYSAAAWVVGAIALTGTATYFFWPRGTMSASSGPFRVDGMIGRNNGWLGITNAF